MGMFDDIDVSTQPALKRMIKTSIRNKIEIYNEVINLLYGASESSAAKYLELQVKGLNDELSEL